MKIGDVINILAKDNIQPIVKIENKPKWEWIDGWKVVRSDMRATVNDFQFERGGTYEIDDYEELYFGTKGFHFFENWFMIHYCYKPGYRIFKIKAYVPTDRKQREHSKQVAAKIVFGDEVDFKTYQKIFYKIDFINSEIEYQEMLNRPIDIPIEDYIISKAAKRLEENTGLSSALCAVLIEDMGDWCSLKRKVDKAVAIYNEPTLSKDFAIYLIMKKNTEYSNSKYR